MGQGEEVDDMRGVRDLQQGEWIAPLSRSPEEYLFYDVEVFAYNSMVVFKNYQGETVRVFSSSIHGLGELYDSGILLGAGYDGLEDFINGKVLVGYNNKHYDDYILYAMSKGFSDKIIKVWNDTIIEAKSHRGLKKITICDTLDTMQQIDVSKPSLKKIEGNLGVSIVESSVPFTIDRPLTASENLETFKYCEYDVGQTVGIFKLRSNYFETKRGVVEMIGDEDLKKKAHNWNTTSIVGQILAHKERPKKGRLVSDDMLEYVPQAVQDMWQELDKTITYKFKQKEVVHNEFGNVIKFGWGGLHSAPDRPIRRKNVKLADVASMYPNILILFEGFGEKTKLYKAILDYRLRLKHEGKKAEQEPYKLVLNSSYGLLNSVYSQLYQPNLLFSICMYGQISVYVLAQRLYAIGAEIVQINTDGVMYCYEGSEDQDVITQWENEFKLTLEIDRFKEVIQKDVSNYIAIYPNGKIKTKGGDVNKYSYASPFKNCDIRIVQMALVDYLVYDIPVQDTIRKHLDKPILYQYVLQAGGTYSGVVDYYNPEECIPTKTNRVFAVKRDGIQLLKKRKDGGMDSFADAPRRMMVHNESVDEFEKFSKVVDLQWYYDLTVKKLELWRV